MRCTYASNNCNNHSILVAPPVRNLEAYSVDENSAELRFQLPLSTLGIPQFVYVKYCHPLLESNCKTEIHNLTACLLWNNLHCISVTNLQSNYEFNVSVALKNYNTPRNGAFKNVLVSTKERGSFINFFVILFYVLFVFQFQVNLKTFRLTSSTVLIHSIIAIST